MMHRRLCPILKVMQSAAIFAALFLCAHPALAQSIRIEVPDGGLVVVGEVLGFDGTYLRLDTPQGEVTLDYRIVDCTGAACPDPENFVELIRFSGTNRLGELILPALVEGYARDKGLLFARIEERAGQFHYDLQTNDGQILARMGFRLTTSEAGFADLIGQEADIVMSARQITDGEVTLVRDAGMGRMELPGRVRILAFDALVPIVAPEVMVSNITLQDLARAFAGEVANWSELGGPDLPVRLHLTAPDDGLAQAFEMQVLAPSGKEFSSGVIRHDADSDVVDAVMSDPGALGIASFEAIGDAAALPLSGSCGLQSTATLMAVRTGDYPLTMPLFLYLPVRRLGAFGQDFLNWTVTADAQRILRRIGVPGQEALRIPLAEQGERLAAAILLSGQEVGLGELRRLVRAMDDHDRMSLTFRFAEGASGLDPTSLAHVRSLAQSILDGRYNDKNLLLVGFSDGIGPAEANRALSAERAASVKAAVLAALGGTLPAGVGLNTVGFGEAMPMGCDASVWGRRTNRRVELWVASAN